MAETPEEHPLGSEEERRQHFEHVRDLAEVGPPAPVSLADMKTELRIDAAVTEHDGMLGDQIAAATEFIERQTGVTLDADAPKALRQAVILYVRELYGGFPELKYPSAAVYQIIAPYRRLVSNDGG